MTVQLNLQNPSIRFGTATDLTSVWRTVARSGKREKMSEADNQLIETLRSSMHPNDLLILLMSKQWGAEQEALFLVNEKERRDFEDLTTIYEALKPTAEAAAGRLFRIIVDKLLAATRLHKADNDRNYGYYLADYQVFHPKNGDKEC
jgi:hypothetical protein